MTAVATRDEKQNALSLVNSMGGDVSTMLGTMEDLKGLTASGFLPSLKLFSGKTKACGQGLIGVGRFGIQKGADSIQDLGDSVDIIPLAIRAKAIDVSERGKSISCYDSKHPVFLEIAKRASSEDQKLKENNMFGPSFLVYERSTGSFLEYFCTGFYQKIAANQLLAYLPMTPAAVAAIKEKNPNSTSEPRDPQPVTLKAKYMAKAKHPCHAPEVLRCSAPFGVPVAEALEEIRKFVSVPALTNGPATDEVAEPATDAGPGRAR